MAYAPTAAKPEVVPVIHPAATETHLPTLGPAARLVAPTLGGALLGGALSPLWVLGFLAGAALGLFAGIARNREVASVE